MGAWFSYMHRTKHPHSEWYIARRYTYISRRACFTCSNFRFHQKERVYFIFCMLCYFQTNLNYLYFVPTRPFIQMHISRSSEQSFEKKRLSVTLAYGYQNARVLNNPTIFYYATITFALSLCIIKKNHTSSWSIQSLCSCGLKYYLCNFSPLPAASRRPSGWLVFGPQWRNWKEI